MAKKRRRIFEREKVRKYTSDECIRICLAGLAGIGTAAYADLPNSIIGGQESNNSYSALFAPGGAPLTTLPLSSSGMIQSVAINNSGVGLIGGEGNGDYPTNNYPYAGYVSSDGSVRSLLDITTQGYIYSVAINDAGNGLIGGRTIPDNRAPYAALVLSGSVQVLTGLPDTAYLKSVAINNSGVGLIGGEGDNDSNYMYAAIVAANGDVTRISNTPATSEGLITSVGINDAGKGLIGGWSNGPYAAFVDPDTHLAAELSPLPINGQILSVAINSGGNGLIGGYSSGAYAGSVNAAGVVTAIIDSSFDGSIYSVAINDTGAGLIGGNNSSNPYAALVAPDGGLNPLSLSISSGSINSVAINQAGVGIIGGQYDSSIKYAALVAPNGTLTLLDPALGSINSVAINDLTNSATPASIGPYYGAIFPQLGAISALETRFIEQNRIWKQTTSAEVAELDHHFDLVGYGKPLPKHSAPQQPKKNNSIWIAPFGDYVHLKAQGEVPQYTNEVAGILAAYDHQSSNYMVGGALGYAFNYLHYSESLGHGKINEELACVYGSYYQDHFWLDAALWGGLYQFHNERHTLTTITSTAHTHGWILSPHFEMAMPWEMDQNKNYFVEPFVMLDWVNTWQKHFTESGPSGFNITMDGLYGSLLQSELGLRFYEKFQYGWGRFLLEEKLSYVNQAPFHFKDVSTFFVGSASSFPIAVGSTKVQNLGSAQLTGFFVPNNQSYPYGGFALQAMANSNEQSYFASLLIGKDF